MEATAAPLRRIGGPVRLQLNWLAWLVAGVVVGGGMGLLVATNERLAVSLLLAAGGAAVIARWPFPALVVVLVLSARPSPIRDLTWFCALCGGAPVLLWQIRRAAGRLFLVPLGLLLVIALFGLNWTKPLLGTAPRTQLMLPLVHFHYLTLPQEEATTWLRLAFVFMVGLLAGVYVRDVGKLRIAVVAALIAGAYPIWMGIDQFIGGKFVAKGDFSSVRGTFDFPNEFGIFLVLFLLLAIVALFEFRHTLVRIVLGVLIAAGLVDLLHTYTRAAWVAFAAGLVLLALLKYRRLMLVGVVLLVVAAVSFPGAVNSVQARFGDLANQNAANAKNSLTWRRGEWKAMWHYGSDEPLFGQGFGSYRRLTVEQFGLESRTYGTINRNDANGVISVGFTAHNDFVKSWVESGAVGLALWVAVLVGLGVSLARALRFPRVRPWAAALLSIEVGFVLMSLSDNVQGYTVPLLLLVALSAGVAAASKAERISVASRANE